MVLSNKSQWKKARWQTTESSEIIIEKSKENLDKRNVSVITKTIRPNVIIKSENINENNTQGKQWLIKSICLMIMCIIILITFFLSLKTYNMVHELSNYILP